MPTETTDRRDRYGFPIVACYRCGGSGRFSFNPRDLDMCYGCKGTGWVHAVPKHHAAWREAVRTAVRVLAQDLQPGDHVRRWGQTDPITGRRYSPAEMPGMTVRTVNVTATECGWTGEERTPFAWETELEFDLDDGGYETCTVSGATMWHRLGIHIDPAPYVAKAERGLAFLRSPEGQARMTARRREREAQQAAEAREAFDRD